MTTARRNLISNIHIEASLPNRQHQRIAQLAARMIQLETSGVTVKEEWSDAVDRQASLLSADKSS